MHNKIVLPASQKGAALLAVMLIVVVSASYVLVSRLNRSTHEFIRQGSSLNVLNEAKAALIGYAVNYPETHPGDGPGFLPCPDRDNDGDVDAGACSLAGNTTIGRIPWKTLETSKLTDSTGEVLWYAVADNFRNNPKVSQMNSDVTGDFSVNTTSDIVAVIIAPGVPTTAQNRANNPLSVGNYLEGDNADLDNNFVTTAAGEFNDTVVYITRQELMSAVEKRVLGDVSQALVTYQSSYNAYPWLSPFENPALSTYRGEADSINAINGHIPFHWSLDPDSIVIGTGGNIAGRNPFTTDITLSWSITSANVTNPGTTSYGSPWAGYPYYNGEMITPDQDCIVGNICTDENYPGLSVSSAITFSDASCTWSNKDTFQCTGTYVNTDIQDYPEENPYPYYGYCTATGSNRPIARWDTAADGAMLGRCIIAGNWYWNTQIIYAYRETVTRTYSINITYTDDTVGGADIIDPTNLAVRTRDIVLDNTSGTELYSTGSNSVSITINETRTIQVTGSPTSPSPTTTTSSTRVLTNDSNTTGTITAAGLHYDLDADNGELPAWFFENGWHELIYVAYASGESTLPGSSACTAGTDCISVSFNGLVENNARGIVINAGLDLTGSRPSGTLSDYFEGENTSPLDELFAKDKVTSTNNDQLRIITTAP